MEMNIIDYIYCLISRPFTNKVKILREHPYIFIYISIPHPEKQIHKKTEAKRECLDDDSNI